MSVQDATPKYHSDQIDNNKIIFLIKRGKCLSAVVLFFFRFSSTNFIYQSTLHYTILFVYIYTINETPLKFSKTLISAPCDAHRTFHNYKYLHRLLRLALGYVRSIHGKKTVNSIYPDNYYQAYNVPRRMIVYCKCQEFTRYLFPHKWYAFDLHNFCFIYFNIFGREKDIIFHL